MRPLPWLKKSAASTLCVLIGLASPGLLPYAALAEGLSVRTQTPRTSSPASAAARTTGTLNLQFSRNAIPTGLAVNSLAAGFYNETNTLAATQMRSPIASTLPLPMVQAVQAVAVQGLPANAVPNDLIPSVVSAENPGYSITELRRRHNPNYDQQEDSSRGLATGLRSFAGKLQGPNQGQALNVAYHNALSAQNVLSGVSSQGLGTASRANGLARWSAATSKLAMALRGKSEGGGLGVAPEKKKDDPFRKKKQVAWTSFYVGGHNLKFYSRVKTWLDPDETARMDAINTLIKIADHNIQDGPIPEELLEKVRNPSPALVQLLEERGLTQAQVLGWQPITDQLEIDRKNYMPPEIMHRGALMGVTAPKFPVEEGGLGLSQLEYGRMFRPLAPNNFAKAAMVSANASIGKVPIEMFGTLDQIARFVPPVATGKAAGAFGLTEVGAGTDLDELATRAEITGLNLNVDMTVFDKVDPKAWAKLSGQEKKVISDKKKAILEQLRQALLSGKGKIFLTNPNVEKVFITNVWNADYVILIAGQTWVNGYNLGATAFIVPLGYVFNEDKKTKLLKTAAHAKKGLEITHFIGTADEELGGQELNTIRSTGQSFIVFKKHEEGGKIVPGYEVEGRNLLGPIGKGKMLPMLSLDSGRVGVMALSAASMSAPYQYMKAWVVDRKMFKELYGGRLGDIQRTQRMLGEAAMKVALSQDMADFANALVDYNHEKGDSRSVAALSAAAKVRGTKWGKDIMAALADLMGGHFHFTRAPHRMELAYRQSLIGEKIEGVNPAMAQLPHKLALGELMASKAKAAGTILWNVSTKLLPSGLVLWTLALIALPVFFGAGFSLWSLAPYVLLPLLLAMNRGDFSLRDAYYIQNRTARAAMLFDTRGLILGEKRAVKNSDANIDATEINTDIFMLMDTLKRLKDDKLGRSSEPLSEEDRIAREFAIEWLRARIDQQITILPRFLRWLTGRTPNKIATRAGRRIYELALTQNLPPVVEQHKEWNRQFHDDYQRRLQEWAAALEAEQTP